MGRSLEWDMGTKKGFSVLSDGSRDISVCRWDCVVEDK